MVRLSEFLAEQGKGTYKNCKKKKISVKVVFVRKSLILFHYSWSQLHVDRWAIQYVESKNKIHVGADFADFADF